MDIYSSQKDREALKKEAIAKVDTKHTIPPE